MSDTTTARRALLMLLLDRVERGALLPAEGPLLRACVTAEIGHGQATIDAFTADAPWLKAWQEDLAAETRRSVEAEAERDTAQATIYLLRQVVREANAAALPHSELDGFVKQMTAILDTPSDADPAPARRVFYRGTDGEDMHAAYMHGQAALARVRALFTRKRPDLLPNGSDDEWHGYRCAMLHVSAALDGTALTLPGPVGMPGPHADGANWPEDHAEPDDTPPTRDDGRPTCRRMETRTCPDTYNGEPCGDRPCARFESEDPTPWVPDGTPTPVLDALRNGQPITVDATATADRAVLGHAIAGLREQAIDLATYGNGTGEMLGFVPGTTMPVVTRCSPLVNPSCPGHTGPDRCERAASHPVTPAAPPDWAALNGFTDWATSADEQCPARYTGESPHLTEGPWQPVDYQCERRRTHVTDSEHAVRQPDQGAVFCWTDAIAIYPADAPAEPQQ